MTDLDVMESIFSKFFNFIRENHKLTHLNLTAIDLPNDLMCELIHNIKRNQSLHCVHLCGNNLSKDALLMIKLKLKPTFKDGLEVKGEHKQKLIRRVNEYLKMNYLEEHEKIYNVFKRKEMNLEWMSVQKLYEKDNNPKPLKKIEESETLKKALLHRMQTLSIRMSGKMLSNGNIMD